MATRDGKDVIDAPEDATCDETSPQDEPLASEEELPGESDELHMVSVVVEQPAQDGDPASEGEAVLGETSTGVAQDSKAETEEVVETAEASVDAPVESEPVGTLNQPAPVTEPAASPQPASPSQGGLRKRVRPWMLAVAAVAIVGVALALHFSNLSKRYEEAASQFATGDYETAAQLYQDLGKYKDSAERSAVATLWANAKEAERSAGVDPAKWTQAAEAYDAIQEDGTASSSAQRCRDTATYYEAMALIEGDGVPKAADLKKAIELFEASNGALDADSQISYCESCLTYLNAKKLMDKGAWAKAAEAFDSISESGIADAQALRRECYDHAAYDEAEAAYTAKHYYDAYNKFRDLVWQLEDASYDWLPDLNKRAEACKYQTPENSVVYRNGAYGDGSELTIDNSGNDNTYYKLYFGDELIISVFVRGDSSYTFMLPSGTYRMNKAYGDQWWGPDDMFGDEGMYLACSFDGADEVTLEYNNGYLISAGSGGTGIGTSYTDRGSF